MSALLAFDPPKIEKPDSRCFLLKGGARAVAVRVAEEGEPDSPGTPSPPSSRRPARPKPSHFRRLYQRGDLPIAVEQDRPGRVGLRWTMPLQSLDVSALLPIFAEGLTEERVGQELLLTVGRKVGRGPTARVVVRSMPGNAVTPLLPRVGR